MKQQTAVNWLIDQIKNQQNQREFTGEQWLEVIEQAKAMEKDQIEDAFQDGKWDWHEHITKRKESKDLAIYYNETYGK